MAHVLIVDDEQSICWGLSKLVRSLGHSASIAPSAEQAFAAIRQQTPDAIVLDVRLPGLDGLAAMDRFREELGAVPVIVITAYGELATAVEAVRKGAFEYLVKPFDLRVAQRAIERSLDLPNRPAPPAPELFAEKRPEQIVGSSRPIQEVFKQIAVVAPTQACVHLRGESGVGKELVARAIHRFSRRSQGPFVPVNLAALSPSLAESELFGHVRGSFTGAEQTRKGLLQQARGGTIFLDEVADVPMAVQVKLLRVLEYDEMLPVGADRPVRTDFRIITATHQNLCQRVAEGTFRHDLYFRLIAFEIEIPALRERRSDIADLASHFADSLAQKNGFPRPPLPPETIQVLENRPWYGNVRELRNALEHAMILARGGAVLPEHLPPPSPPASRLDQTREALMASMVRDWACRELDQSPQVQNLHDRLMRIVEPPLLRIVLQRNRGQFSPASRQLGLHRVTLRRKMNQFDEIAK